jgi:hypothetical protein
MGSVNMTVRVAGQCRHSVTFKTSATRLMDWGDTRKHAQLVLAPYKPCDSTFLAKAPPSAFWNVPKLRPFVLVGATRR